VAVQEIRLLRAWLFYSKLRPLILATSCAAITVILNYKSAACEDAVRRRSRHEPAPEGTTVYVKLEKRSAFHEALEASLKTDCI